MGRNHANRIVIDIDPIYANKDWEPERFQPPTYRVAAYTRVSENSGDPQYGLKCQQHYYETAISVQPAFKYVGLYADEGITGASARNRKEFDRLVADCKAGKIDMIFVKRLFCLGISLVASLKKLESLLAIDPLVGVYIEEENINTFTTTGRKTLLDMIDVRLASKARKQDSKKAK